MGKKAGVRVFVSCILVFAVATFLFGCSKTNEVIAKKLIAGERLTDVETNSYAQSKDVIDTMVKYSKYVPMTPEEKREGTRKYRASNGEMLWFDTSERVAGQYGFSAEEKVLTPSGLAYVVGVNEKNLYFHIDDHMGASYWSESTKEWFEKKGFRPVGEVENSSKNPTVPDQSASHVDDSGVKIDGQKEKVYYLTDNGDEYEFNISSGVLEPFGFHYGDYVDTPKGPAKVIGVNGDRLWFHIDGDKGATHWGRKKKEYFMQKGFYLIKSASS